MIYPWRWDAFTKNWGTPVRHSVYGVLWWGGELMTFLIVWLGRTLRCVMNMHSYPLWWCFSVAKPCLTLCDPVDCRTPGFPVHHHLPEFTQTHVHLVGDAIQPSHPLSSPSPPTLNLSQHRGLSQCVSSLHQVAKVLEFQLQHQSFQWISPLAMSLWAL